MNIIDIFFMTIFIFSFMTIFIFLLVLTGLNILDMHSMNTLCEDKGFEYAERRADIEPGYIKCCSTVYVNHEAIPNCQIFGVEP